MLRSWLLFSLFCLPYFSLHAEERTHSGKLIVGDSSENTYSNSSESMRQTLKYSLGLGTAADQNSYFLGYYWNPDLMFEFHGRAISGEYTENGDQDWNRRESALGFDTKFFFKDAWMLSVGLLRRQAEFTERYYYVSDDTHAFDIKLEQVDVAARFGIGSQWQWSSFFVGFDWIAYEVRLGNPSTSVHAVLQGAPRSPERVEERARQARAASRKINRDEVTATMFRFGFAF